MRARRGRRSPRARALLLALVVLVLLNGLVLVYRRPLDARSDTYMGLARVDVCESLGHPNVIYLGSSRTAYGIDASLVDANVRARTGQRVVSCNAGAIGSTFEQDYYTLKRLIEDGQTPKLVVETLWEWNLNVNSNRTAQHATDHFAQVENLADLGDLPRLSGRFANNQAGNRLSQTIQFLAQKLIPLYGDRIGILRTLCGPVLAGPCGVDVSALDPGTSSVYHLAHRQGWVPAPGPSLAQMSPAQITDKRAHDWTYMTDQEQHFEIGGIEPTYLQKLITLARQHGAQVALVAPPLSQYFWDYFKGPTSWSTIMAYWQRMATRNGATFYDLSRAQSYTAADFVDMQHLSPTGARQFSTWLARTVVAPAFGGH